MAAKAGLCLAWTETPEDTSCRVVAHCVLKLPFQIVSVKEVFRLTNDDELVEAEEKYLPKKWLWKKSLLTNWKNEKKSAEETVTPRNEKNANHVTKENRKNTE